MGRFSVRLWVAVVATAGGLVGVPYALSRLEGQVGNVVPVPIRPIPILILAGVLLVAMVAGSWRTGLLAGVMAFGGMVGARVAASDIQEALLAVAAIGLGLGVAAALRSRENRSLIGWASVGLGVVLLAVSMAGLSGGRGGLPTDEWGESLQFVTLGAEGVERALLVATEPDRLPGDSRRGPGFWYRVVDTRGPTLDQAVLAPMGEGDAALDAALNRIVTGATLEPGELLSQFGIRWIIAVEEASELLTPVLAAQVDLNPFPFAEGLRVYENVVNRPVAAADDGTVWEREGTGFAGPASDTRVRLAVQGGPGWGPDWQPEGWAGTVDGSTGHASYRLLSSDGWLAISGAVIFILGLAVGVWERVRR